MTNKNYRFMNVNNPQSKLSFVFDGTVDGLKNMIEEIEKNVDKSLKESIKRCEDGRTNLCNHDMEVIGDKITIPYDSDRDSEEVVQNTFVTTMKTTWALKEIKLENIIEKLSESKTIGKHIEIGKTYKDDVKMFIGGFKLKSKKDAVSTLTKKAIIKYMIAEGYSANYKLKLDEYTLNKVKCSHIQLFLDEKFDTETLCNLIIDECNI